MNTISIEGQTNSHPGLHSFVYPADEESLILKYRNAEKAARRKNVPLTFEFTRDPALLHQYYQLRTRMFTQTWDLHYFDGSHDEYDDISDILLIRKGRLCVGGARLVLTSPQLPHLLPAEDDLFSLKDALPDLNLSKCIYGECSRFAVLPDFQDRDITLTMLSRLIERGRVRKANYLFWIAPAVQTRYYRQLANMLEVSCSVRRDIMIPDREEYEGIGMYLSVIDLTGAAPAKSTRQKAEEFA